MKQKLTLLFLMLTFFANAQYFGKFYPYWEKAGADAVIAYDDGYAMMGFASKSYNDNYLFIIRTDLNGDTLWTKQIDFEGMANSPGHISAYTRDSDDNIYLTPSQANIAQLIKLSSDFEVLWMKKYEPAIEIKQLKLSKDGNLLFTGINMLREQCLYKADTDGNIIWQSVVRLLTNIPGGYLMDYPGIAEMENDEIVLTSVFFVMSMSHACDIYHFTKDGDTISSTKFGWVFTDVHADGNELIGLAHDGDWAALKDNLLVRFQPNGTVLSSHPLNFTPPDVLLYKFVQNSDGELIAAGGSAYGSEYAPVILHAVSSTGDSLWSSLSMASYDIFPYDIAQSNDGGYVVTGYSSDIDGENTPFLLKTDARGTLSVNKPNIGSEVSVYPNPAREKVAFETPNTKSGIITITDIFGRTVDELIVSSEKTIWNSEMAAPGTYFYQINDGKMVSSGKFLIVK